MTDLLKNRKPRIAAWDYARIISAFVVVLVHTAIKVQDTYGLEMAFTKIPLSNWAVVVFFVLSGASLIVNYPLISSFQEAVSFYKKRFRKIFPMFWFVWFVMFVLKAVMKRSLFWGGNPLKILLSVCGLDGYLHYIIPNYYSVGEWFLGALIILYVLYPLLLSFMNNKTARVVFSVLLVAAYLANLLFFSFQMDKFRNPLSCILVFWVGMLIGKYYHADSFQKFLRSLPALVGTVALLAVFLLVPMGLPPVITMHLVGILFFLLICQLFRKECPNDKVRHAVIVMGKATYAVFLTHHVLADNVFHLVFRFVHANAAAVVLVVLVSAVIFACGVVFDLLWNRVVKKMKSGSALKA